MVKITIIEEKPIGYQDRDLSIEIPESGELEYLIKDSIIPKGIPTIDQFKQHFGHSLEGDRQSGKEFYTIHSRRHFPSVKIDPFYILWIEERKEWVGIEFNYKGCESELDGNLETIEASGPYRLNQKCSQLISQAYGLKQEIDVIHTSPEELKKLSSGDSK